LENATRPSKELLCRSEMQPFTGTCSWFNISLHSRGEMMLKVDLPPLNQLSHAWRWDDLSMYSRQSRPSIRRELIRRSDQPPAVLVAAARGRSSGALLEAGQSAALVTTDRVVHEARRRIELGLRRPELPAIIDGLLAEMTV
jgi:hypothetical protein